jgi:hypothetical protein
MEITRVEDTSTEYQGWAEWEAKFKPKDNHLVTSNGKMFETYGEELEYLKTVDPKYIWTYVDGDMSSLLLAGYHYVNRLGYYVTEVPWDNEYDSCLLSVETECECYDEDRADNGGEYGDENCDKCEGYGYVTDYL